MNTLLPFWVFLLFGSIIFGATAFESFSDSCQWEMDKVACDLSDASCIWVAAPTWEQDPVRVVHPFVFNDNFRSPFFSKVGCNCFLRSVLTLERNTSWYLMEFVNNSTETNRTYYYSQLKIVTKTHEKWNKSPITFSANDTSFELPPKSTKIIRFNVKLKVEHPLIYQGWFGFQTRFDQQWTDEKGNKKFRKYFVDMQLEVEKEASLFLNLAFSEFFNVILSLIIFGITYLSPLTQRKGSIVFVSRNDHFAKPSNDKGAFFYRMAFFCICVFFFTFNFFFRYAAFIPPLVELGFGIASLFTCALAVSHTVVEFLHWSIRHLKRSKSRFNSKVFYKYLFTIPIASAITYYAFHAEELLLTGLLILFTIAFLCRLCHFKNFKIFFSMMCMAWVFCFNILVTPANSHHGKFWNEIDLSVSAGPFDIFIPSFFDSYTCYFYSSIDLLLSSILIAYFREFDVDNRISVYHITSLMGYLIGNAIAICFLVLVFQSNIKTSFFFTFPCILLGVSFISVKRSEFTKIWKGIPSSDLNKNISYFPYVDMSIDSSKEKICFEEASKKMEEVVTKKDMMDLFLSENYDDLESEF